MDGEQAYGTGQIFQHGDGQIRMQGKDRLQPGAVHGHQLTPRDGYGGRDPGLAVEKGGLPDQVAGVVERKGTLVPLRRADKALHGAGADIVELERLGILKVDQAAGRVELGLLLFRQWGPYVSGSHAVHLFF